MSVETPTCEVPLVDFAHGDDTGLKMPLHPAALADAGAEWLTAAFRQFGVFGADNHVARIVDVERCPGGSTGAKLFLEVDYARNDPGLHRELFVKFSRDFTDARRDRMRYELAAEVPFAAMSRLSNFPINVPAAYFADYEKQSGSGLLITERVQYDVVGVEPHRAKCLDYLTLRDPVPYYRLIVQSLARLAGAQKAGKLSSDIEARFPFDPELGSADPIRCDEAGLWDLLEQNADFARRCPQLLPPAVVAPEFQARMREDALLIWRHQDAIRRHLSSNRAMIALLHWNAHIDNCWFWREERGPLQCGLLDWGRTGQITFGAALWGTLSGAGQLVWNDHLDELLGLFISEYNAAGGGGVTKAELRNHLTLHLAVTAVSRILPISEMILYRLPQCESATDAEDPMFESAESARSLLHHYRVCMSFWQREGFGVAIDQLLQSEAA